MASSSTTSTAEKSEKKGKPFHRTFSFESIPFPSTSASSQQQPESESDTLLTRLILTPILFISFLISLFIIDRKTSSSILQHSSSSSVKKKKGSDANGDEGRWYYHSHQKKLARLEMDQAFRIRGVVIWWLLSIGVVGVVFGCWVLGRAVGRWKGVDFW